MGHISHIKYANQSKTLTHLTDMIYLTKFEILNLKS